MANFVLLVVSRIIRPIQQPLVIHIKMKHSTVYVDVSRHCTYKTYKHIKVKNNYLLTEMLLINYSLILHASIFISHVSGSLSTMA